MNNLYSHFNLVMMNLWIGMCRGVAGMPRNLRNMGYNEIWIEFCFKNSELQDVVPELILVSDTAKHTLLIEWKSGANTEPDQLRRYSRVTGEDLRTKAYISPAASENHDVTVIGKVEHQDRLKKGIKDGRYKFPLLSVENKGIRLVFNRFSSESLNHTFDPFLEIVMSQAPTQFVPFDHDSPLWAVAEVVIPKLLEYFFRREPRVLFEKLASDTVPTWICMSPAYKKELLLCHD